VSDYPPKAEGKKWKSRRISEKKGKAEKISAANKRLNKKRIMTVL